MLSTDLGGIYVCCHVNLDDGAIHHNWIRDAHAFSVFWGTRGIYLDLETFNSTIHHNVVWNLTGSHENFSLLAGSPRGAERVYNNTFMTDVRLDGGPVEARNNIFAGSKKVVARQSNNIFAPTKIKFARPIASKSQAKLDFTPRKYYGDRSGHIYSWHYPRL